METIVNSKGQFVIPSKILRQLGIRDKSFLQIDMDIKTGKISITPLRGKYRGKGLIKAFMAEKKQEKAMIMNKNSE